MATPAEQSRVVFLCTGNSCRSQMAQGWTKAMWPSQIEAFSAGTRPQALDPLAIRAMKEEGIDISGHESRSISSLASIRFDLAVTVCDHAAENCPVLPSAVRTIHVPFDDPPRIAHGAATGDEAMIHYRRIRDQIRAFVATLPDVLRRQSTQPPPNQSHPHKENPR